MSLISNLQQRLDEKANLKTKDWWERYLKHVIPFRGVKMADIRACVHSWIKDEGIDAKLSMAEQKELALNLIREKFTEDKLAGILYLQEVLIPSGAIDWRDDLPKFASLFDDGYIYDWNTCDWFCVRVLGLLSQTYGEDCARAISEWKASDNLWQRRASGVALVNLAKNGDENFPGFIDMLLETCRVTVQSDERFAQTGTGWVLRELSVADQNKVGIFVEGTLCYFSHEGLRYSIEKMSSEIKARLIGMHKELKGR